MLSTEEYAELEKSEIAIVQRLWKEYKVFIENPYVDSYLSALHQLAKWDDELKNRPVSINDNEKEKEFDRVLKYLSQRDELLKSLDATRSRMSPQETEKVDITLKNKKRELRAV